MSGGRVLTSIDRLLMSKDRVLTSIDRVLMSGGRVLIFFVDCADVFCWRALACLSAMILCVKCSKGCGGSVC